MEAAISWGEMRKHRGCQSVSDGSVVDEGRDVFVAVLYFRDSRGRGETKKVAQKAVICGAEHIPWYHPFVKFRPITVSYGRHG